MKEMKSSINHTLLVVFLLILTLPLIYLLFAKVLLPLEWKEDAAIQDEEAVVQEEDVSSLRHLQNTGSLNLI